MKRLTKHEYFLKVIRSGSCQMITYKCLGAIALQKLILKKYYSVPKVDIVYVKILKFIPNVLDFDRGVVFLVSIFFV